MSKLRTGLITLALVTTSLATTTSPSVAQETEPPPPDSHFEKVTLNDQPGEPMDLAVLPRGSVLHTTRDGQVWFHDIRTGVNKLAARLDVYEHDEEGLQSVAVDPNFKRYSNNWVYLYYAPPLDTPVDDPSTPDNEGDAPEFGDPEDFEPFEGYTQLSRFRFDHDRGELDLDSEEEIIRVAGTRGVCCHVGGDIVFDSDGDLYLSTGDDSNPFASDAFTPIDEREDRNPAFDAQRTSANTNDLRGKLLRITPQDGGGYTIPEGNLFPEGTPGARPEILAMGFRNPFRIEVDPSTDDIYVGDYSPDARSDDPDRGPAGQGRWMIVDEPANYGWPYCVAPDLPYVDYDFATEESADPFDCTGPVNESPHNTGLTDLPPVAAPEVRYSYGVSDDFPGLESGGIGPMAGPVYDSSSVSPLFRPKVAWPDYFDGKPLFYEWTRDYVKVFDLDGDDQVAGIATILEAFETDNPMDLEFGPNGALYMLEYGDGFFRENPEAQLSRINYIGPDGNHTPEVSISAEPTVGDTPLTVEFTSDVSDAEGDMLRYGWDFDGDGRVDSRDPNPTHTYTEGGLYLAHLSVEDRGGPDRRRLASDYVTIAAGNAAPVVEFVTPSDGDTFSFGDAVDFEVEVTDDQPVDCDEVEVHYILGHEEHGHPQTTASGCTGTIQTIEPTGHDPEEDELYGVFVAEYTDPGEGDVPSRSGSDEVVLDPVD